MEDKQQQIEQAHKQIGKAIQDDEPEVIDNSQATTPPPEPSMEFKECVKFSNSIGNIQVYSCSLRADLLLGLVLDFLKEVKGVKDNKEQEGRMESWTG